MKSRHLSAIPFIAVISLLIPLAHPVPLHSQDLPYLDPGLDIEERVDDLVSRMTLEQKILQMQNGAPAIPELQVPEYDWWNECLHGVARAGEATVFPQAIGMAATWNPDLIHKEADIISTEARAKYNEAIRNNERRRYQGLTMWSPNINIFRDPRWGRGQETYGEDPFLTSKIGVAFVKGLQGDDPRYLKVVSTPKHFAVHSGPEPLRHTFDVDVSDRDLHETYLPAFKATIMEGGAYSIMGAYNRFRGESCSAHELLLGKILRDDWGFKGYIVSDCGAIRDIYNGHHIVETQAEASALAVKRGCDLTCGREYGSLLEAVEKGLITEAEIDVSVKRLMTARFRLGMFDPPGMVPYASIPFSENDSKEHDRFALEVARQSMVLLKNENNTLPLSGKYRSIAVIGPYADNLDVLEGNYNGTPSHPVTILNGIRDRAGEGVKVAFAQGVLPPESNIRPMPVETKYLKPSGGMEGNGITAAYFNNPDLEGDPVEVKVESTLGAFWRNGAPIEGLPNDNFSVRWTGTLTPEISGAYELGFAHDDRGRLYLDGELIVDHWENEGRAPNVRDTVNLVKGRSYEIRAEYADLQGFAYASLVWQKLLTDKDRAAMMEEAVKTASGADVAVIVAGISPRLEGEEMRIELEGFQGGDRTNLRIPRDMEELIQKVQGTGKPVVLVLTSGSALALNWEEEHIPAILQAWYPGQQGGHAVADVLLGNYNPAGRLPVTYYKSVEDLPDFENYDMKGRTYRYFEGEPLYPFGYGLSYSKFDYKDISVSSEKASPGETITVSVKVTNQGPTDGDEVVQLYVRDLDSQVTQPIKSLKGFKRQHIKAGETADVSIPLTVSDLGYYHGTKGDFVVEPGSYEIQVGASSADIRQVVQVELR